MALQWVRNIFTRRRGEYIPVVTLEPNFPHIPQVINKENSGKLSEDFIKFVKSKVKLPSEIIVVNMEYVRKIDSSGIAAFITGISEAKKHSKRVAFINLSESVYLVFDIARITDRKQFPNAEFSKSNNLTYSER